jgi:hypothetical protein
LLEEPPVTTAKHIIFALQLIALCLAAPLALSAQDASYEDWQQSDLRCVPACRSGHSCQRGECVPTCSPACGSGFVCGEGGACVRATPKPTWREPAANSCTPDCRSGFTCLTGRCVSLCNPVCSVGERCTEQGECVGAFEPEPPAPPRTAAAAPSADPSERAIVNLHADALGALQFGVTPTVEVGETVSGYLRLRAVNSGLLSYFALGRDAEDELRWGAGAALGMHVFFGERGNMRGFYLGGAVEYAYLETRDSQRDFATYRTHALIPQLDAGYRWAFGGLLVGVAARFGLAIPVHNRARPFTDRGCAFESSCQRAYDVAFIPGIAVDLGWFIPRAAASE